MQFYSNGFIEKKIYIVIKIITLIIYIKHSHKSSILYHLIVKNVYKERGRLRILRISKQPLGYQPYTDQIYSDLLSFVFKIFKFLLSYGYHL